ELREDCLVYWPEGFTGRAEDFGALLDEMVGLGVLARDPGDSDRYMLFSPTVIALFGGPDRIIEQLANTDHLEIATGFQPHDERRVVDADKGVFSPLSEQTISQLAEPRSGVTVVAGTDVLGLGDVEQTLKVAADTQYGR